MDQQINVSALHVIFRYTCSIIYMNINVHPYCSIHFLWNWQGEFVEHSRASLDVDHFLYSHDLDV